MKRTLKFSPLITLFVVAAILVSRPPVRGQILQYPLCAKGCVTSYRSYTAWNAHTNTIPTDNTRQGTNPYETQLRASTLVQNNFKFQGSLQVDGQIYAQPLYMSGLKTSFVPSEQAVFVATEHGSVYAINGTALQVLAMKSLLPSGDTSVPQADLPTDTSTGAACANITYEVGITGTPVIDPTTPEPNGDPVLFPVVKSKHTADGTYPQTLHAWDPLTNTELQSTSTSDIAQYLGWNSTNKYALMENQRAGLALAHDSNNNAIIYVAWGSHCDSSTLPSGTFLYDGWVAAFGYNYTTNQFSLLGSFTDEPQTTGKGGIWMAGSAPAIDDTTGNVYLVTGNGNFSTTTTPKHFGESILQLGPSTLPVSGAYTPNKWATLNNGGPVMLAAPASPSSVTLPNDQDLGSSGAALLKPVSQSISTEVLAAGKEGVAYVLDPTLMSNGLTGADTHDPCSNTAGVQPLQCFQPITLSLGSGNPPLVNDGSGTRVVPAFWGGDTTAPKNVVENILVTAGSQDTELRYWQMFNGSGNNGTFNTTIFATQQPPSHGGTNSFPYPGGGVVISWDDTVSNPATQDAIVWVLDTSQYPTSTFAGGPAVLLAYPALPLNINNGKPIFTDSSSGPLAVKFQAPVVVAGEVYVAGQATTQCTVGAVGVNCGVLARFSE